MRTQHLIYYLVITVLTLISIFALQKILPSELYVVSLLMMFIVMLNSSKRDLALSTVIIALFIVYSSWALATQWTTLPRSDPLPYYEYLKNVADAGRIIEHDYMDSMPFWPLLNTIYSEVCSVSLLETVQLLNSILYAILVPASTIIIYQHYYPALKYGSSRYVHISFVLALILATLSSFTVFNATNPKSASLSLLLGYLITAILTRIFTVREMNYPVAILMILFSISFVEYHLYESFMFFITYLIMLILLFLSNQLKLLYNDMVASLRVFIRMLLIFVASLIVWYLSLLAVSPGEIRTIINALLKPQCNIEERAYEPLTGIDVKQYFEELYYIPRDLLLILDRLVLINYSILLIPAAISCLLTTLIILSKRKHVMAMELFFKYMLSAAFIVTPIQAALFATGLDKLLICFIPLIAVVSGSFIGRFLVKIRSNSLAASFAIMIMFTYVSGSVLTLGSKNYPAIFVWSGDVTPESMGFSSRWGSYALHIINTFIERSAVTIYADSKGILNALAGKDIASDLLNPSLCTPDKLASVKEATVIIILRNFLPYYIAHKYVSLSIKEYRMFINSIKKVVVDTYNLVYYEGSIKIYYSGY